MSVVNLHSQVTDSALDFAMPEKQLVAEAGSFSVVEIHGGREFAFRAGQDTNLHRVLIRANMASAESADKRPASYASMRDSASAFQASATRLSSGGSKLRSSSSISSARSIGDTNAITQVRNGDGFLTS
nr:hypothetical protein [Thiocystis violacea]